MEGQKKMEKKTKGFTIYLAVLLTIQMVLIFLALGYALWGTYENNHAANFWSVIWGKGAGLFLLISDFISMISGIVGLILSKGSKARFLLSILLLVTFLPSLFCLLLALGTHL